jgi:hypothetical protein
MNLRCQTLLQPFRPNITQLADLASQAKPGLLILDHVPSASTEELLKEMTLWGSASSLGAISMSTEPTVVSAMRGAKGVGS